MLSLLAFAFLLPLHKDKFHTLVEKIRIQIYRIYVLLKMIVECKLKNYGKFDWMYDSISTNLALLLKKER